MKSWREHEARELAASAGVGLPAAQRAVQRFYMAHRWWWAAAIAGIIVQASMLTFIGLNLASPPHVMVWWIFASVGLTIVLLYKIVWKYRRLRTFARQEQISPSALCSKCGYDLRGSPQRQCPECGARAE